MSQKGKTRSQDIRSFFAVSPKAPAAAAVPKKTELIVISSDDEETNSPSTHKKSKPTKKQKKRNIFIDSDDESESSKKSEKDATPAGKRNVEPPVKIFEVKPIGRVDSKIVSQTLLKKPTKKQKKRNIFIDSDDESESSEKSEKDATPAGKRKVEPPVKIFEDKPVGRVDSKIVWQTLLKKLTKKQKKCYIFIDSDDESESSKKSEKDATPARERKVKPPVNFFEDKPVGRVDSKIVSKKEAELQQDDGFEAALIRLDTSDLEAVRVKSESHDEKTSGKRKLLDEPDERVEKKKARRDSASSGEDKGKKDRINENVKKKTSSPSSAEKKSRKEGTTLEKKIKLDEEVKEDVKTEGPAKKLNFGNLKPSKEKSEIVVEKDASPTKGKKDFPKKSSPPKEKEAAVEPAENFMKVVKVDPPAGSSKDDGTRELALVEKYRPTTMARIIGQHGDRSVAKKLYLWLSEWHENLDMLKKPKRPKKPKSDGEKAEKDLVKKAKKHLVEMHLDEMHLVKKPFFGDCGLFKVCLLSGPPGVGKTTTARIVCAELGYDILEFNGSDTISKALLQVSSILSNTTIKGYFSNAPEQKVTKKRVLLMDEVDVMAGNEDRRGLRKLMAFIKKPPIPIICICNNRHIPKMRTLANYAFDLTFWKPKLEQIRGAMKTLCHKENIKVTSEDIDRLIVSTNYDIRQVINHLAMYGVKSRKNEENSAEARAHKDARLGPGEVARRVFSAEEHKKMSIHDKSDLFFHNFNLAGLFVQQNYASVCLSLPRKATLQRIASAADSLAMGDLVEDAIRSNNEWSLLPTQAIFSSVIPGTMMSGRPEPIRFPQWLHHNSRRMMLDRLMHELSFHTRLTCGLGKETLNLENAQYLRDAIARPLVSKKNDGIDEAVNVMNTYHLTREDFGSLMAITMWSEHKKLATKIDSKVKAAFTRAYNENAAPLPYMTGRAVKKMQASQDEADADEGSDKENDGR